MSTPIIDHPSMKYEQLFDGKPLPVLGLGTWNIGGSMVADRSMDEEYVRVLRSAIQMGYRHIDTAQMYGDGHSEELVGVAVKFFRREDIFITTKVWSSNLRAKSVVKNMEQSLKRLGTDYVDLYLIHWPNPSIPLEDTYRAFNKLVKEGIVHYVGVSNFNVKQLAHAQNLSDVPIATNQVEYNVLRRQAERNGVLKYCLKQKILLTAYEPFGKGAVLRNSDLQRIAERYETTPAQLAIYWLTQKSKVITIPKSSNVEHLRENLKALESDFGDECVEELNRLEHM
jgi:diketogulonate reductase-like aldo/keto reductase